MRAHNAARAEILIQNLINSERPALAPHHPCISINNNKGKKINKQTDKNREREVEGKDNMAHPRLIKFLSSKELNSAEQ